MDVYYNGHTLKQVAPRETSMLDEGKITYTLDRTSPSYILLRVDRAKTRNETIKEVEKWCEQCKCGKRVNLYSFAFKTDEELTMFQLRWS